MPLLVWFLCLPWVLSAADKCETKQSLHKVSSALDTLQCYNNYKSRFHCTWKEEPERHSGKRLQLRFHRSGPSEECQDHSSDVNGTRECQYKTDVFSPYTTYTAFFDDPLKRCSSIQPRRRDLSLLLRALTPVDLTTSSTEEGGRLITWSSPYPQSSALNDEITYQVNYRPHGRDDWTAEELKKTQKELDQKKLIPGHKYEAKVRARVRPWNWSHWSPIVSWHTPLDPEQAPRVDCVLRGKQKAECSWEQSIELGHFISYQLLCRPNHTDRPEKCCEDLVVTREDTVKFSCLLPLTQFSSSTLLELVPTLNIKTFSANDHIQPDPPTQVHVKENGQNWVVKWTPAKMSDVKLAHEVRYYSQQDEEDAESWTLPPSDSTANVLGSSLRPSRRYWVKVRSLVMSPFKGTPSNWSPPVEWTSQAATLPNWCYAFVVVPMAAVFIITLYIIPACKRRYVLWDESVPSPDKSKVILDIQAIKNPELLLSQETYLCKVMDIDSVSTRSTIMSLLPKQKLDILNEETEDEGIWSCDNLAVSLLEKSSLSFSGPYIFCPSVDSKPMEEDSSEQTEVSCTDMGCPVVVMTAQSEEGYVRLPSPNVSVSAQCLLSHCSTDEQNNSKTEDTEEDQYCPSKDYTSEAFWPQGGTTQGSGYCQLPTDFTQAQPIQEMS